MLFRCSQTLFGLLTLSSACSFRLAAEQKQLVEEGKRFGKEAHAKGLKFGEAIPVADLTPPDQRGKVFDPKQAKKKIKDKDQSLPSTEAYELLQSPATYRYRVRKPDEESLKHADDIVERFQQGMIEQNESDDKYEIQTCLQVDAPFEMHVAYNLAVQVKQLPAIKKTYQVCKGHENLSSCFFDSVKSAIKKRLKNLAADSSIKTYSVEDAGNGWIRSCWTHHDNAHDCDSHYTEEKEVGSPPAVIKDKWLVLDSQSEKLARSPNCTFIKSTKFESGVKIIDGVEVNRDGWKKIDIYMCRQDPVKCPFLSSFHCQQISKKCKQKSGKQCAVWELTFKCLTDKNSRIRLKGEGVFGTDEQLWETSYKPNTSFSEATTKLKIFDEMKKEFENSTDADISRLQLFGGKKSQCSKSIASDLMYDCCFAYKGLTNDLKLSKCTSDEIALAEKREKGLCYYIGSYKKKMLNLWTSRKEHVYCCFPTKLARVLQQEGRRQLGIKWGTPKKPLCRGLTQAEIQRLDLSKLDLSEAYEVPPSVDMTNKIHAIEKRLKARLKTYSEEK